jgi:drug/metabolite transporter (DMT)-like permease
MLVPIFTSGLAIYILAEPFTMMIGFGAALVLLGVGSLQLKH